MQALMRKFRTEPPSSLGGLNVVAIRDYENQRIIEPNGTTRALAGPLGDLVIFDLAETGNYIAARPSGTEPKVKFYLFTYVAPELLADLDDARQRMSARMEQMRQDIRSFADAV
jgi:phosphoglucomutase/phosphomannomutase